MGGAVGRERSALGFWLGGWVFYGISAYARAWLVCIYYMDGIGLVLVLLDTTGLRKLEADGWLGKGKVRKGWNRHNHLACIIAILL